MVSKRIRQELSRSVTRRPAKAILPPDVVDGGPPDRPIIVRISKVRFAASPAMRKLKGNRKSPSQWQTIEISIPREIAEITGWEVGMTIAQEAYTDGRIRMYPAGDVLSREDAEI
jgi:hypothetical protein